MKTVLFVGLLLLFGTTVSVASVSQPLSSHPPISSRDQQGTAALIKGQQALEQGAVADAIAYFEQGKELLPADARFELLLGIAYAKKGDDLLAENALRQALLSDPLRPQALQILADLYYRGGRLALAREQLQLLQKIKPDDPNILRQLDKVSREYRLERGMSLDVNAIFNLKADRELEAAVRDDLLAALIDAYGRQGSLLNFYPEQTVQVILYQREGYDLATGAPAWSAGRFDGKIRLPVPVGTVDVERLKIVMAHEYNHFLAQQLSGGRAPAWLYEGLAMAAEKEAGGHRDILHGLDLNRQIRPFAELEGSFSHLDMPAVRYAYAQSYAFVGYLIEQFGWHTQRDLLLAFRRAADTEQGFAAVFSGYGLDFATLVEEWRRQL